MRHKVRDKKLGRSSSHRKALMASLVCHLIEEKRIKTTLMKAKEARRVAEKMVTLGLKGTLAARRQAISILRRPERVATLFDDVAPQFKERPGGYTRITKLGQRRSDGSEMAILEWVGVAVPDKKRKPAEVEAEAAA
ncbi:MAG: 50S ribosomal protein L17 [Verrucomicrobia bacterium]|jgi:large subunit ribosomal protein L17|nr:50S ribosomal protein L17 [Verrucomicrobiota bacterium]MBT7066527.1 50S ribosomal protein L17 [Verrucomicrobiota bacterium]MBT7698825.1 50S ribosomal protein L17 [Verrucomicrobiota bacterium]